MATDKNLELFERARALIPGGVNSPVRAFRAVGGTPRFVQRAEGAYFWDANGQRCIDYIGSWGPMILGHGHPKVLAAVQRAVTEGFSFGAPTEREIELAEEIVKHLPSVEMVRLVSSGTEAAMSAIRLARGATGRSRIIKFEGCYHGHADALLVFDEVMTGFRVGLRGAQGVYAKQIPGFAPDLTVLGKVIGGGMPLAAFGGPRDLMEKLAPLGPVYQAGTLSGNPVATACGLATLQEVAQPGFYEALARKTQALVDGLTAAAREAGVPFAADCEGGMFGFFLLPELPQNYPAVMKSDAARFGKLFHGLLDRGVYIAPALYEAGFVSSAHSEQDIAATVQAAKEAFRAIA